MPVPAEVVLAHGGADSNATLLIMAALGVSALVPVVALALFFLAGVGRRDRDRPQTAAAPADESAGERSHT